MAALAASVALATVVSVLLTTAHPTAAGPIDCTIDPDAPECTTTTTVVDTTTTLLETTTTFVETTSTEGRTATTEEVVQNTTTTTTVDVSTSHNVLVPGDGTEGAESTTTTTVTPTTISNDGTSDAALIALVVGGLVLLAVAVGILTWRYWLATRPPAAPAVGSDDG